MPTPTGGVRPPMMRVMRIVRELLLLLLCAALVVVEQHDAGRFARDIGTMHDMTQGPIAMTGNPLEMLGGAAMTGVGVFSGVWNTATAIGNGMSLGDAASGIGHVASSGARAIGSMASDAWHGAGNAIQLGQATYQLAVADAPEKTLTGCGPAGPSTTVPA